MMKRFLTGVLSIIAGTALVLTSFAGACSEDKRTTRPGNAVSGLPGAFWNPFRNGNSSGAGTGMDRSRGDRVLSM